MFARIAAFCLMFSLPAWAGSKIPTTYEHVTALAEMRVAADDVADLYFDLVEAQISGASEEVRDEIVNRIQLKLKSLLIPVFDSHDGRTILGYFTGKENRVRTLSAKVRGYLGEFFFRSSRRILPAAAISGAFFGALGLLGDQSFEPADLAASAVAAAGAVPALTLAGEVFFGPPANNKLIIHTNAFQVLFKAFTDQLKARGVPFVEHFQKAHPATIDDNVKKFVKAINVNPDTVYGRLRLIAKYGADSHGRADPEAAVRGWIKEYSEGLDSALRDASPEEKVVIEEIAYSLRNAKYNLSMDWKENRTRQKYLEQTVHCLEAAKLAGRNLAAMRGWVSLREFPKMSVSRTLRGDHTVPLNIQPELVEAVNLSAEHLKRAQRALLSPEFLAAVSLLFPGDMQNEENSEDRPVGYREAAPVENPEQRFGGRITLMATIKTVLAPTSFNTGIYEVWAGFKFYSADPKKPRMVQAQVRFNSRLHESKVLAKENVWIGPLAKALLAAAEEQVHAVNACEDAFVAQVRVDENAEYDELSEHDEAQMLESSDQLRR